MKIAVVGVGLIGGSIGMAARAALERVEVIGAGRDRTRLQHALDRDAIDSIADSPEDAVADAQACFVCGPVGVLADLVARALAAAPADCVVTDVGSTKRELCAAIDDERFVGGHPIAGAETAGVEHARLDLFQGATWYLTPAERSSGLLYERLHGLLVAFGARPVAVDPEAHDRLLATVSHLPHVLANVLVAQAARTRAQQGESLPRVGPSFRDATRVAGANSAIWTDIYLTNREAIADEVDETARRLGDLASSLRGADGPALTAWNEQAADDRRRLLEADLQGGPVHELRLSVPNRPGIVAQVALELGKGDVNIVDLALAPAPDMRSGAMTLWIAGDAAAARARALIEALGFSVSEAS